MNYSQLSDEELHAIAHPKNEQIAHIVTQTEAARAELEIRKLRQSETEREERRLAESRANDPGPELGKRDRQTATDQGFRTLLQSLRGVSIARPPRALMLFIQAMQFLILQDRWRAAIHTLQDAGFFRDFEFNDEVTHARREFAEVSEWFDGGEMANPDRPVPPVPVLREAEKTMRKKGIRGLFLQS